MQALTIANLLIDNAVLQALEAAWIDSLPHDPAMRHEEGGWVYMDTATGAITIRRAMAGVQTMVDLGHPPLVYGSMIIATFHTHPNPTTEGWKSGPSNADKDSAHILGVPCLIRADDGIHTTGPSSRRGGLTGNPGFPY